MQQFKVSGMSCGHCVRAITQAIQALEQTARVEVDLAGGWYEWRATWMLRRYRPPFAKRATRLPPRRARAC